MDRQTIQVNGLTSLQQDSEYKQYDTIQSMSSAEYILKDNRDKNQNNIDMATNQPMVNFSDGYGINQDKLNDEKRTGKVNNFKGDANQLFPRPYLTIPYTGMGNFEVNEESKLQGSHMTTEDKATNSLSGIDIEYQYTPLVKNLKDNIQNPNNIIQENSKKDWTRGGIDTTQIRKDLDYFDRCLDNEQVRNVLFKKKPYLHGSPKETLDTVNSMNNVNPIENTTSMENSESMENVNFTENSKLEGIEITNISDIKMNNNLENLETPILDNKDVTFNMNNNGLSLTVDLDKFNEEEEEDPFGNYYSNLN